MISFLMRKSWRHGTVSFLLPLMVMLSGCASLRGGEVWARWSGKTVYSKVAIRAEIQDEVLHAYSTNHIGLPIVFPAGTRFVVVNVSSEDIRLRPEAYDKNFDIEFVPKHHLVNFARYLDGHFSEKPFVIPADLNAKDKVLVQKARVEKGMSRKAFFLANGYPPASLSPDLLAKDLKFDKKRFNSITFSFNDKDELEDIDD